MTPVLWFRALRTVNDPDVRMICFPYAGAGQYAYAAWAPHVPAGVDVQVVQLPGRGPRSHEPSATDIGALADEIAEVLSRIPLGDRFALFGHSMGAFVAFEVACRLRACGAPLPERIFLSAAVGPDLWADEVGRSLAGRDPIELSSQAGWLPDSSEAFELVEALRPGLEADYGMLARYQATDAVLDRPLAVLWGDEDRALSRDRLQGWRSRTTSRCLFKSFPGAHFYIDQHAAEVVAFVADMLLPAT